ncbi:GumC family protein [Falsiroseomonas sp. HW251]|uniref:GumC family protein n=1 Tax=Falsiroseomonas sp. HW251 TaxID=3390998 RepID=UPI003D31C6EE
MQHQFTPAAPGDGVPRSWRAPERASGDASAIGRLFGLLVARKWTILVAVLLGVGAAAVALHFIPPRYFSQATVVVGARVPQVVQLAPVMSSLEISPFSAQSQVETEMQIVRSRGIAERLMERLHLEQDPEFNPILAERQGSQLPPWLRQAIAELRRAVGRGNEAPPATVEDEISQVLDQIGRRVSVEQVGRSTALAISASSSDAEKAALIANTVAELYVSSSQQDKIAATNRALSALRDRMEELQRNLVASERAVERYRIDAGLVDRDDSGSSAQQITEIRQQLTLAQAQTATAAARQAQLRDRRNAMAGSADVLNSATIARLREQEVIIDRELRDVATRFGDRHPETIGRRGALDAVRARIRDEIERIAASIETELQVARDREAALRRELADAERQAGARNEAAVRLRELRREADANRRLYETFLQRYQEVAQQVGLQQSDAQLVSRARASNTPSWPPALLFLGLAGIASLAMSSLWVVLRELRRGSLHDPDGVEELLQMPTMALIPRVGALQRVRGMSGTRLFDETAFGEAIQLIRVQIGRLAPGRGGRIVLFTSAISGEGKTSVATACARMAARAGESVIVIDCDMRRSRIERIFGKARHGLAELLSGRCALEDAVQTDAQTGLSYIASHPRRGGMPMDMLGSEEMEALLRRLVEQYDLVVLDTPPVLAVADALAVAPFADATLMVVDAERTPRQTVRSALNLLMQAGIDVGGIILSKVKARHAHNYGYEPRSGGLALPRIG